MRSDKFELDPEEKEILEAFAEDEFESEWTPDRCCYP
jgi:hypothetical protein